MSATLSATRIFRSNQFFCRSIFQTSVLPALLPARNHLNCMQYALLCRWTLSTKASPRIIHVVSSEGGVDVPRDSCRSTDCLLYTSDAADERSSVDLGGRRIIKKKKT